MQQLRRISRPAYRRLYCLLLQLLVILAAAAAAARISETGVSDAAEQRVSGGNAAAVAAARLFAQRLTSISSPLSQERNIKGVAKMSAIISGRGGDTKLAREKAKELNLPDDWDMLVGDGRGSLVGGKEVAGVLVTFQMKDYLWIVPRDKVRGFINAITRFIMNGRLRGVLEKYFESKVVRKEKVYTALVPDTIDQDLLIYIVGKDVKDNENLLDDHILKDSLVSEKKEMFGSIRRKRFLHEVNTGEQNGLKNSRETSSVNTHIRQKRHSWHFMGENFWAYAPQSYVVYSGVPTIMVQWPPIFPSYRPHETKCNCKTSQSWEDQSGCQSGIDNICPYANDNDGLSRDYDDGMYANDYSDSSEEDSTADGSDSSDTLKDGDSSGKKLSAERLKTGGLSQMLQYNKNTYKKNPPLDHLKTHYNQPRKNILDIPWVGKQRNPIRRPQPFILRKISQTKEFVKPGTESTNF